MKFHKMKTTDDNERSAQPPDPPNNEINEDELADVSEEDLEELSDQLDELNSALDVLVQKNDSIQAGLKELLQSSRELRNSVHNDQN